MLAIIAWLALGTASAFSQEDVAVLLDGTRVSQRVMAIDDKGMLQFEGDAKPVDLQGLRRIERPVTVTPGEAAAIVHLAGGGAIRAKAVAVTQDECQIDWLFGKLKLPLSAVRGIRLNTETDPKKVPGGADQFDGDVAGAPGERDRLYVIVEGKVQSLQGIVVAVTPENVTFNYEGADRTLPRDKAFGLTLAGTGKTPALTGLALLTLSEGSAVWTQVRKMENGVASVKLSVGPELALPWAAVARVQVRSDRLAFVSDLTPVEVYQSSIADIGPHKVDLSVRGRPLSVKGRTFEKGLGMHATCRVTFNVDPRFNAFAATIGIDDETKGKGDCEFVVLGDGKELFRKRMRGGDAAVEVAVKLPGVKQLTLAVEAGEDLDFGDHGNWCDARLIRE
jgi:hypothetical protein